MRNKAPSIDLRPCTEAFTQTDDGWKLGVRQYKAVNPDPKKLPVVLCHGLGLNGTFWTITDDHMPHQLARQGYDVFVVDLRGSGASHRLGRIGRLNSALRQTPFNEWDEATWSMDDLVKYDVPAILDHVRATTGKDQVNWIGHSLGGMLMFAFLETSPQAYRIANFVGMGSTPILENAPKQPLLNKSRQLRVLLSVISTGRIARPMTIARLPGLESIDRFYYTSANVDDRTISRFYGYTLENPGRGAMKQLDSYLEFGHMLSVDGKYDYAGNLGKIQTPTLLVAGEGDIMADVPSMKSTYTLLGSPDKSLVSFGRAHGHAHDYGHCDLVWSRHAPREIFPAVADWLDTHQPVAPSPQALPSRQGN